LEKTDVLIIGGGIVGTSAAFFLSKQGVDIILVERSLIGREASGSNAGTLSVQTKKAELIHLAREGTRIWSELQEELEEDLEFRQHGGLRVAEDSQQLQVLLQIVKEQKKLGIDVELLSSKELETVAPYISSSVVAASFCKEDGRSNPLASPGALARAAQSQGARIHEYEAVKSIKIISKDCFLVKSTKGEYQSSCILNSAGVWSRDIFRMIGLDFPITLDPQQVMVTEQVPKIFPHLITHVKGNLTLKQMDSSNVVIGGGWKGIGNAEKRIKKVSYYNMQANIQYACRVIPGLKELNLIRCWTGLEGRTPDFLPIIGNLTLLPGFYSASCCKGGYHLGPLWGRVLTELILSGKTSIPIAEFDVNRFVHHLDKYFTVLKEII
jgi:sarcosine oxidase subunit beta